MVINAIVIFEFDLRVKAVLLLSLVMSFLSLFCDGQIMQKQKITPADRAASDRFGHSVSISGSYAIVGAYQNDKDATGTNVLSDAGGVYIFERNLQGTWVQKQKLVASDRATLDYFGYAVSISGDYAVVSAIHDDEDASGLNTLNNSGSIYVFERNVSGVWVQVQKVTALDRGAVDEFGYSVSISGNKIVVGSYLDDEDPNGGNTILNTGSVYVFQRNTSGVWQQMQKISASDRASTDGFGVSVSIFNDRLVVGAYQEDEDANGSNTKTDAGSAYLFTKNSSGVWVQTAKLVANDRAINDHFGISVAMNDSLASVGAFTQDKNLIGTDTISDAGAVYVYKLNTSSSWVLLQKVVAPDRAAFDWFGYSISMNAQNLIVGAYLEDENVSGADTKTDAGSAYIFKFTGTSFLFSNKIISIDRAVGDNLGEAVGVSGNLFITGAFSEDENSNGTNTIFNAGSAYFFGCPIWYLDNDLDGYGNPLAWVDTCIIPANYVANNTDCNDNDFSVNPGLQEVCGNLKDDNCNGTVDEVSCSVSLNIRVFIQGFYNAAGLKATSNRSLYPTICDTVTVLLATVNSPNTIVYSTKGLLNINGEVIVNFNALANNNTYYIVIRHRNSVEVWSKLPVTLSAQSFYDFTQ